MDGNSPMSSCANLSIVECVVLFSDDHDVVSFITHSLTPPKKEGEVITVVFYNVSVIDR